MAVIPIILTVTSVEEFLTGEETSNQMIEHKLQAYKTNVNRNNKRVIKKKCNSLHCAMRDYYPHFRCTCFYF